MTDVLPEQRYAASFHRQIEHVKRHVKCLGVADLLCGPAGRRTGLKRSGDRWVGLCPLPDHDEKTPSFTVYEEDERGWYCYGCKRGGDVLDLWMAAHRIPSEQKWTALVEMASHYGVELLGRTERWHEASMRKAEIRDLCARVAGQVLKRRLFRLLVWPEVEAAFSDAFTTEEAREREFERAYREFGSPERWERYAAEALGRG